MNVLENLISQATSPTSKHYNSDTLKLIVDLINKEPNGPAVALRLLAHKIQSPQEREALCALTLLEGLTKQCGRPFISELGKFKFLNEMVKVLSPNHLGNETAEAVKAKCRKLLFQWQRDHGATEPKFTSAYKMLCDQGLISPDSLSIPDGAQRTNPGSTTDIFDRNQHSARLTALLRSRNPKDVAEANRIIQSIVKEDEQRMEKETQRSTEMESLKNNTLLLNEMVTNYARSGASEAELELMSELADNISKARPVLYSLSLMHDENDIMMLTEIARICEQATSALEFYAEKVTKTRSSSASRPSASQQSATTSLDLANPTADRHPTAAPASSDSPVDLLTKDLFELGLADTTPTVAPASSSLAPLTNTNPQSARAKFDELEEIFSNLVGPTPVTAPTSQLNPIATISVPLMAKPPTQPVMQPCYQPSVFLSTGSTSVSENPTKTNLFDDLNDLGRQMLGLDNTTTTTSTTATPTVKTLGPSVSTSIANASYRESRSPSHTAQLEAKRPDTNGIVDASFRTSSSPSSSPVHPPATKTPSAPVDLSSLDVQLSAIEPHPRIREPQRLYPPDSTSTTGSGVQLDLHYAGNRPAPDVSVFVAVVMNRSALPVTDLLVRFLVNKPLQLRNLTASGQTLSAYSPFLPVGAINQVILIYDPVHEPTIDLKFQLSFNLGDDAVMESGSAKIPCA